MIDYLALVAFVLLCCCVVAWLAGVFVRRGGSTSAWQEAQREPEYGPNSLVPDMTEHVVVEPADCWHSAVFVGYPDGDRLVCIHCGAVR